MAIGGGGKVGTGYVEVKPDTKGFGAELERGVESEGKRAGSKLGGAVGVAAKGAFAAGVAGMAKGVLDFGGFDAGMREVFTLMPDLAGEARAEMTENVKSFASEFGVIPDEVIPSLYNSISAGVPPDNVFDFLEQSQKLAKGGATDLGTAVDGLSTVVNSYGSDVIEAAEASDAMFTAVKLGKTTVDELSGSMFQVAPIAASFGVSFQDVSAAFATLTAQGTPTAQAATQMKGAIAELGKDGTKASKAFQEITGKTFPEFIEGGGTLVEAAGLMSGGADDLGLSLVDLFGSVEAGQAFVGLAADLEKSQANLDAVNGAAGATDVAFAEMNQGLSATMDRLKAKFAVTLIDLGEALAPTIETVGMAIAGLVDAFNALPAPMRTAIVVGGTLFAGLVAFAGPLLKAIQLFGMLGKAMTLLAANPWMIAVLALIAVTYLIIKNWDAVVDALEDAWEWIKDTAEAVGDFFVGVWETTSDAVVAAWDGMVSGITTAIDAVVGAVETAWDAIVGAFEESIDAVVGAVEWGFDLIETTVETYLEIYRVAIETAWDTITTVVETAWDTITGVVSTAVETVRSVIDFGLSLISEVISRNVAFWTSTITTAWNGILTITQTIWNGVTTAVDTAVATMTGIVNTILGWPSTIANGLASLADAIAAPFRSAFESIRSAWNSTVGGFGVSIPGVLGFGGVSFSIPSMATGGVAFDPMVAQIGDAGPGDPEIVSPVSLMRQTVIEALGTSAGGAPIQVHTHLHADGLTDTTKLERLLEKHGTDVVRIVERELERTRRGSGMTGAGVLR